MERGCAKVALGDLCRALLITVAGVLVFAPALGRSAAENEVYGAGISEGEVVAIGEILANPERFEGKRVLVTGRVSAVCPKRGCWMELEDSQSRKIQVKVEDGVIVFPTSLVNREVVAEGIVEILNLSREQYMDWRRHQAEEAGLAFDPGSVGEGPYRIVRLRGIGAKALS